MKVLGLFDVRQDKNGQPEAPYSYRADLLHDFVDLKVLTPATNPIHKKVRDVFEHRLHMPMDLALRSTGNLREADLVFAFLEQFAIFPSALKKRGISGYRKKPLVALSCWWAEEISSGSEDQRESIRKALEGIDGIICFSENQRRIFETIGYAADSVYPIRFGVDPQYYRPDTNIPKDLEIVAAGIDRGRDYDTLVQAAKLLPHRQFDIFTQPGRVQNPPKNMRVHGIVDMETHKKNLQRAQLVVIPTHDLQYPTGQSVLLEAMACGTATAVTETNAMREYIGDGVWNFSMPLYDASAAALLLEKVMSNESLRENVAFEGRIQVETNFNFTNTWRAAYESLERILTKFNRE